MIRYIALGAELEAKRLLWPMPKRLFHRIWNSRVMLHFRRNW